MIAIHTEEEKRAILAFAGHAGPGFRDDAITAHRALITRVRLRSEKLPYGDPYFEFMREIDTPAPDYSLRSIRRKQLLDAKEAASS